MQMQANKKAPQLSKQKIEHQRNVTSAAYTYNNINWMTIRKLAHSFGVSENTIANWLCEAIEYGYVATDAMCESIMKKHVAEYETEHHINNSCLRGIYARAMVSRSNLSGKIDLSAINGMATA